MPPKLLLIGLAAALLLPVILLAAASLLSSKPRSEPVTAGRLPACPSSPNCVSTQADDATHAMQPLPFAGTPEQALQAVQAALESLPGVRVTQVEGHVVQAEATSRLFRFVDDIDCVVDAEQRLVHFRSASRVGHSDFGANRARMQRFRDVFARLNATVENTTSR